MLLQSIPLHFNFSTSASSSSRVRAQFSLVEIVAIPFSSELQLQPMLIYYLVWLHNSDELKFFFRSRASNANDLNTRHHCATEKNINIKVFIAYAQAHSRLQRFPKNSDSFEYPKFQTANSMLVLHSKFVHLFWLCINCFEFWMLLHHAFTDRTPCRCVCARFFLLSLLFPPNSVLHWQRRQYGVP